MAYSRLTRGLLAAYSPERRGKRISVTVRRIFAARADQALIASTVDARAARYKPAIIQSCSAIIVSPVKCPVCATNGSHLARLLLAITALAAKSVASRGSQLTSTRDESSLTLHD